MNVEAASWDDVVDALELEAASLGDGVAWGLDRVREWWDSGVETAVVVKDHQRLLAYACAMHITAAAFEAIAGGGLNPEDLELSHTQIGSGYYWVGIVVVDPEQRGRGVGRVVLLELTRRLHGRFVADVYTEAGKALVEAAGWTRVLDAEHPIYVLETRSEG